MLKKFLTIGLAAGLAVNGMQANHSQTEGDVKYERFAAIAKDPIVQLSTMIVEILSSSSPVTCGLLLNELSVDDKVSAKQALENAAAVGVLPLKIVCEYIPKVQDPNNRMEMVVSCLCAAEVVAFACAIDTHISFIRSLDPMVFWSKINEQEVVSSTLLILVRAEEMFEHFSYEIFLNYIETRKTKVSKRVNEIIAELA